MQSDDEFRASLENRINSYREAQGKLRARIDELADQLLDTNRRLDHAQALYAVEFGDRPVGTPRVPQTSLLPPSPAGPFTGLSWNEAIERVLAEAGNALHVREIWNRLSVGGFRTDARDPLRSIAAVAVRHPHLVKVQPNTYRLVNYRLPGITVAEPVQSSEA